MKQRSKSKDAGVKERFVLNQKMHEDDQKSFDVAMAKPELKDQLETCFFAVLGSGRALATERCDMKHFRDFVVKCGYASNDRHLSNAIDAFDARMGDDEHVDFVAFVKTLFHMAMRRYNSDDYHASLKRLSDEVLVAWYAAFKHKNFHDGTGPDSTLLDLPEVDRLLYVYDTVFDRLFNRYRDVDQHANRELAMEQVRILDNFVEVEELKELCKDYQFFPKHLSYVEISRCSQWSCFGRLVVDPTRQGAGRFSSISEPRRDSLFHPLSPLDDVDPAVAFEEPSINPLFVPQLPTEFRHDEALLDKPRFMVAMLRVAQALFCRPDYVKRLPTICSRCEELVENMRAGYDKMFGRTMESDCDWSEKGVPILNNGSQTSALSPAIGPMSGFFELSVLGTNWCEKRGVYVRIGSEDRKHVILRAKSIQKKKVVIDVPPMQPTDVESEVHFEHGIYSVTMNHLTKLHVECSNNRWQYSSTDPPQIMTFKQPDQPMIIKENISEKLMKLFGAVCAINDRYNTKFLTREKWKKIKSLCSLVEFSKEDDTDIFFLEVAEFRQGCSELSLDFKAYLRVLSRTVYEMMQSHWKEGILAVAEVSLRQQTKEVDTVQRAEEDELTVVKRSIGLVERRSHRELDVFLGPVLVGYLSSRAGDVASTFYGDVNVHRRGHPFLTYTHVEVNTETILLGHIRVSQSFPHLLSRLLQDGFDFAAHHSNPNTRKPAGRCWCISSAAGERVGAVWDYCGNYGNLAWQSAEQDMSHSGITMSMYCDDTEKDYLLGYMLYTKAKDIAAMRTALAARHYHLTTKLYKLPS